MRAPGARARLVLLVALVLVTIAGGTVAVVEWRERHDADQRARDRAAALRAAEAEIVTLTSISSSTTEEDIDRLLAGATASFRDEFSKQAEAFRTALADGEVTSTGRVTSAGVVNLRGARAEVIAAVSGTVRNKESAEPQPRNYRFRVKMQKVEERWLVAALEFVA